MGVQPRVSPELLPTNAAQTALNCKLFSGEIRPWNEVKSNWTPTKAGTIKSIYLFGGSFWFHWTQDVNVIRGPIAGDTTERTYYTGEGAPKVTDNSIATSGGGTDYPINSYTLGVPSPVNALTATPQYYAGTISFFVLSGTTAIITSNVAHNLVVGNHVAFSDDPTVDRKVLSITSPTIFVCERYPGGDVDPDNPEIGDTWTQTFASEDLISTTYVYTYITAAGEEGAPSSPSTIVTRGQNQKINISAMDIAIAGHNITQKRIYRYAEGSGSGDYQYVGVVSEATTTFIDEIADSSLGEVLSTVGYDTPPTDMHSITLLANGVAVGASGNEICPSEPYKIYAYPSAYRLIADYPIVGIGAIEESFVVLTTGNPYFIGGSHPDSYFQRKLALAQACVSKRSIVEMGFGVIYASPDGLVMVDGGGGASIVTKALFTRDEWQALKPESILGSKVDGRYVGFYDTGVVQGGFIFDPTEPSAALTFTDQFAEAAYSHLETDVLYLSTSSPKAIVEWDEDTAKKTFTWKSKPIYLEEADNMGSAKVYAAAYPVTLKVYADGVLKHTQTVANENPFRLPSGFLARKWEIEASGTNAIKKIVFAQDIDDI